MLQQNLAHIAAAKKSMGDRQFRMAAAVANASTGTGYAGGPGEMLDAIQRASGGDMTLAGNMLAAAKSKAEGARRFDLSGAGFGDMYGQMQAISRAQSPGDHQAAVAQATDLLTDRALDANGPGAMLGGRGRSVENLIPAMQRRLDGSMQEIHDANTYMAAAQQSGDAHRISLGRQRVSEAQRGMQQTLASTAGLLDVAGQISPENARMLADGLLSGTITDVNGAQATVGQVIEMNRGNQQFQEMRREYAGQTSQQHQNAQAAAQAVAQARGQQVGPGQMPPVI